MAVQHLENCLAARSSSERCRRPAVSSRCKKLIRNAAFWCSRSCKAKVAICDGTSAHCESLVSIPGPAGQRSARLVADVHVTLPGEKVRKHH